MIGKLRGQCASVSQDGIAIIDVGGVGYVVRTPLLTLENLRAATELPTTEVSLFIHTAVREDAIDLYGFLTQEDLDFFKQLMSVSGIGPKTAIGILNVADAATLKRSIAAGDATTLTKVFGIGKKSAERLVVELRDKLATEARERGTPAGAVASGADLEVLEALMALGYRGDESRAALSSIAPDIAGTRERVAAALKNLGTHAKTF